MNTCTCLVTITLLTADAGMAGEFKAITQQHAPSIGRFVRALPCRGAVGAVAAGIAVAVGALGRGVGGQGRAHAGSGLFSWLVRLYIQFHLRCIACGHHTYDLVCLCESI